MGAQADHIVRVFASDCADQHGNLLGVLLNTSSWTDEKCQQRAAELGYSETVFVDEMPSGTDSTTATSTSNSSTGDSGGGSGDGKSSGKRSARIRIFTPRIKLPFAGHPTVGTAWLLRHHLRLARVEELELSGLDDAAGVLPIVADVNGATVWPMSAWCPPFKLREVAGVEAVEKFVPPSSTGSTGNGSDGAAPGDGAAQDDANDYLYVWAWENEEEGLVRARSFVGAAGIAEDEATGSAAVVLAAHLKRAITIRQGKGSIIQVAPDDDRFALKGRVVLEK